MITRSAYKVLKDVQYAWREWLSSDNFQWNWYCTFTFQEVNHEESAMKCFNTFILRLNKEIFGNKFQRHPEMGVYYCLAQEKQERGTIHYHVLIGNIPEYIRRLTFMDEWTAITQSIARIVPYEHGKGACKYLAKYITKEGELLVGGNTSFINRQLPLQ